MGVELVTGYAGTPHVTAAQDGELNAGILSTGKIVLGTNEMLAAEIVSNNLVKIKSGTMVNQGRQYTIPVDDYEQVTIDNGAQGKYRNDIIAFRYSVNESTKIEKVECVVIKGTAGTTATDPVLDVGNILDGDTSDEAALYRVRLEGLNIVAVEPMFDVVMPMAELQAKVKEQEDALSELNSKMQIKKSDLINTALKPYNNRCEIGFGGYCVVNNICMVQTTFVVKTTLAGNDHWRILEGFPIPANTYGVAVSVACKDYGSAVSGYIEGTTGALIIAVSDKGIPNEYALHITGAYLI